MLILLSPFVWFNTFCIYNIKMYSSIQRGGSFVAKFIIWYLEFLTCIYPHTIPSSYLNRTQQSWTNQESADQYFLDASFHQKGSVTHLLFPLQICNLEENIKYKLFFLLTQVRFSIFTFSRIIIPSCRKYEIFTEM